MIPKIRQIDQAAYTPGVDFSIYTRNRAAAYVYLEDNSELDSKHDTPEEVAAFAILIAVAYNLPILTRTDREFEFITNWAKENVPCPT